MAPEYCGRKYPKKLTPAGDTPAPAVSILSNLKHRRIKMRRSDREVRDFNEIVEIIERCDVCRLALNDKDYPYILPLNFGMEVTDGSVKLYFHGACEGRKYEIIKKDNRASFEMDCAHRLITDEEQKNCTMEYESVIGYGIIEEITDENEKIQALRIIMKQYHNEEFQFNIDVVPKTRILKLTVKNMTGKKRKKH